jgi:hypothetical protein
LGKLVFVSANAIIHLNGQQKDLFEHCEVEAYDGKLYEWLDDIVQRSALYEPLSNARIPEIIHDVVLAM